MDMSNNKILYVLELENNKFYLGLTDKDIETVYDEHINGKNCEWTQLYKPINIDRIMKYCDQFDLDTYTLEYMLKYDIENVRSDMYRNKNFSEDELIYFQKTLCAYIPSVCIRCGRYSHIFKNCYAHYDINGNIIDNEVDTFKYHINFYKNDAHHHDDDDDDDDYDYDVDQSLLDDENEIYKDGIWYCYVCLQDFESESRCRKHERKCSKINDPYFEKNSDISIQD